MRARVLYLVPSPSSTAAEVQPASAACTVSQPPSLPRCPPARGAHPRAHLLVVPDVAHLLLDPLVVPLLVLALAVALLLLHRHVLQRPLKVLIHLNALAGLLLLRPALLLLLLGLLLRLLLPALLRAKQLVLVGDLVADVLGLRRVAVAQARALGLLELAVAVAVCMWQGSGGAHSRLEQT